MQTRRRKVEDGNPQGELQVSGDPEISQEAVQVGRPGTKAGHAPQVPVAWGNIIVDVLRIPDPAGLARQLRSELVLGEGARTDYGRVLEALDRSAGNFEAAVRLARAGKLEEDNYTAQVSVRVETMRSAATEELQTEYRAKQRRSPTIQDIEDRMVQSWPEEYQDIKRRLSELHAAVRSLEGLRDAWASRSADLRIMADKARPIR